MDTNLYSNPANTAPQTIPTMGASQPSVFTTTDFKFPYLYRFPGQDKLEKILYVTREAKVMLYLRLVALVAVALLMVLITWGIGSWLSGNIFYSGTVDLVLWLITALVVVGTVAIWWWLCFDWRKTIGLVTTFRLVKIVQINPVNSITQSLPLGEVVDTSSDRKGLFSAIFKLSTFSARSSATSSGVATDDAVNGKYRVNKKYFYFENITASGDLEHYMNKLLHAIKEHSTEEMKSFRPFIPHLKAGAREAFMQQYPEYWS